jgi:ribosomal protein L15
MLLHQLQELDHHLAGRADQHLALRGGKKGGQGDRGNRGQQGAEKRDSAIDEFGLFQRLPGNGRQCR